LGERLNAYKPKGDNFFADMLKLLSWARSPKGKSSKGGKFFQWLIREIKRE